MKGKIFGPSRMSKATYLITVLLWMGFLVYGLASKQYGLLIAWIPYIFILNYHACQYRIDSDCLCVHRGFFNTEMSNRQIPLRDIYEVKLVKDKKGNPKQLLIRYKYEFGRSFMHIQAEGLEEMYGMLRSGEEK